MKVRFRFIALVLATQAVSVGALEAQQPERLRMSDKTATVETPPSTMETDGVSSAPTPTLPGPTLPVAAFNASTESTVVVAVAPTVEGRPEAFATNDSAFGTLTPLHSLLGVKTVPTLAPLKSAEAPYQMVTAASAPTFGPPQLPAMSKMTAIRPAGSETFAVEYSQDPVTTDPAPSASGERKTEKIELESIIGGLKSQKEIFGNLKIDPTAITTAATVGPDQRLEYLPDGSAAAWQGDIYCWTAPDFYHNPLYFEQVNLERYGQGTYTCLQPAASAAHFFATIPVLPYKIGGQDWNERVYTLGHRRPGNCNPYQIHYHPFSWRGVTYQVAATTGVVFIVP